MRAAVLIRDNGPGPPSTALVPVGHGLLGMRERAAAVGGRLRSGAAAGGGFLVETTLPQSDQPGPVATAEPPVRIVVADDHEDRPRRIRRVARHSTGLRRSSAPPPTAPRRSGCARETATRRRPDGHPDAARWTASRPPGGSLAGGAGPRPRVLILTTFDLDEYVYDALRAGASGFLLKDVTAERLFEAVRVVATGDALLAPAVTRRLISQFAVHPADRQPHRNRRPGRRRPPDAAGNAGAAAGRRGTVQC